LTDMTDKPVEDLSRRDVVDRLGDHAISDVVEWLKKGVRKDPYWAEAHRLLGDLYLTELEHETYALVEYRKLRESLDQLPPVDRLRLAVANDRAGFPEKVNRLLSELDESSLPETITLIRTELDVGETLERLRGDARASKQEKGDEWFEKHKKEGREFLETGQPFQAQSAFEKALEYGSDPTVKTLLAQALVQRREYPRAVTLLKDALNHAESPERARELLTKAYERLGLDPDEAPEESDSEDSFRQAS
jgi:tetratricopeptide (TPR) repeat protein